MKKKWLKDSRTFDVYAARSGWLRRYAAHNTHCHYKVSQGLLMKLIIKSLKVYSENNFKVSQGLLVKLTIKSAKVC